MPPKPAAVVSPPPALGFRYTPHLLIFASSCCVMIMELVAGRLTGRHMGSSLYTWTSIIGVVLAGMSIGNWIGGKMADRWAPRDILGWLFLISSISCLLCLLLNGWVASSPTLAKAIENFASSPEGKYPTRVFGTVLLIFIIPALALGTISPVTAKMALQRGHGVGRTIGSVYAWGAAGSILGTFLTGFWLIAAMGSTGVVLVVALALALVGLAIGPWRIAHAVWVLVLIGLLYLSQTRSTTLFQWACNLGLQDGVAPQKASEKWEPYRFARDSHYQYVRVEDRTSRRGRPGRELHLDRDNHSFVDVTDITYLEYEYTNLYAAITRMVLPREAAPSAFFIGGGGFTFPRWLMHHWPGAQCEVAEIDPVVVEACHEALGLARDTKIRIHTADARIVLSQMPADRQFDLIYGDAFNNQLSIPWHVATLEFHQRIKAHLKPGGVMLTNIIDDYHKGGRLLGAYINTVRKVFKHVYVFNPELGGSDLFNGQENFIVVATDAANAALDKQFRELVPMRGDVDSFPGTILSDENLAYLAERSGKQVLTDDYAPVENLIAPANH